MELKNRLMIFYGPNGSGKTTTVRALDAILQTIYNGEPSLSELCSLCRDSTEVILTIGGDTYSLKINEVKGAAKKYA